MPKRPIYVLLGKNLVKVRSVLGITQTEASVRANISFRFYQDLEAGISAPSLPTLAKLVRALDCNFSDLLKGCELIVDDEEDRVLAASPKAPRKRVQKKDSSRKGA